MARDGSKTKHTKGNKREQTQLTAERNMFINTLFIHSHCLFLHAMLGKLGKKNLEGKNRPAVSLL